MASSEKKSRRRSAKAPAEPPPFDPQPVEPPSIAVAELSAGAAADEMPSIPVPDPEDELAAFASDGELSALFVSDGLEHLGTIEAAILKFEAAPADLSLLNDIFRPFHTVKGNAGVLGISSVQEVAHRVEALLDLARSGARPFGPREIELVLQSVDLLTLMIKQLPARVAGEPTVNVADRVRALGLALDTLMAEPLQAVAAAMAAQAYEQASARQEPAPEAADPFQRTEESQSTVRVDTRKLDSLVDMVGELVIAQTILAEDPVLLRSIDERLSRRLSQVRRITSELQRSAMSMRMVAIRQTFQKMARLVRDQSKRTGKPIALVLAGEDTELDRKLVEHITDPLMHMVRNAVDHGVEPAAVRLAAGKPTEATLRLSASHQAGTIVIEIGDDGGGLDTDAILAKAQAQGLAADDAVLSPAEIHQFIFQPGFSTAQQVTELSGRGVGMDVVRRNIEALRGRIDIQTTPGQGTTFSIRLPLTLAIVDGILLSVGTERFVIPTFAVRESLQPRSDQVHTVQGRGCMVQVRDQLIPVLHVGEAFGIRGARERPTDGTVVVAEDNGRPVALVVDELLGKQEVVIKGLGETFEGVRGVAGGAILGDGRIGLILDVGGLLSLAA